MSRSYQQHPPWRVELQEHIGVGSVHSVLEVAVGEGDYRGRVVIGLLAAAIWVCSRRSGCTLFIELTIRLNIEHIYIYIYMHVYI